jgi:DNA polymerase-4
MKKKVIFLVDMQSFYASVEKADRPELKNQPVVVSGDPERRSGVILAACPLAKKKGVANAERLWEAQQKCPEAVVLRPRMQRYIDVSIQITDILEGFTDLVEPYSCDEVFCDVTGSRLIFGKPHDIAQQIQKEIMKRTGIYARVGWGPNKVLAKIACDNFAKKNESGIFELNKENMERYMWPLPVEKMFMVGSRMSKHFRKMGIGTIGDLARASLPMLKKRWGIPGHVLWMTANGIDYSPVSPKTHRNPQKAIGHGMTLPRDYEHESEIKVVLLELCEEVCFRARCSGVIGSTISTGISGANYDQPTGFHRQTTLLNATNNTIDVFNAAWELLQTFWDRKPVRRVGVNLSNLCSDKEWQLSLFDNDERKRQIGYTMDKIKMRYGTTAVIRAASLTAAGQATERAAKIGGHYK